MNYHKCIVCDTIGSNDLWTYKNIVSGETIIIYLHRKCTQKFYDNYDTFITEYTNINQS